MTDAAPIAPSRTSERALPRSTGRSRFVDDVRAAIEDFRAGFAMFALCKALAAEDMRIRFGRAMLSVFWVTLTFGLYCILKIIIFGAISTSDLTDFAIYFAAGFAVFSFFFGAVGDGTGVFIRAKSWMQAIKLPKSVFIYALLYRLTLVFALNVVVVIAITAAIKPAALPGLMIGLAAFPLLALNALWMIVLAAILATYSRDLQQLIQAVMRLMLFLSPVLWVPADLGRFAAFADYNPMTHYIALVRAPALDGGVTALNLAVVLGGGVLGSVIALLAFAAARRRLYFWL